MDTTRKKQQSQQPRQLLSCTKCRERKVKCDRTKPCSACCARGAPKECHFVAEGGDYAPIQQSYELRKLRAENLRLKERLRANKLSMEDDDSDKSSGSQPGDRSRASSIRRRQARQKRFQGSEWSDSIYFGSPGLASIVTDVSQVIAIQIAHRLTMVKFASVNLTSSDSRSLTHNLPRGPDVFTPKSPSSYPFATLFPATPEECIPQLLDILPCRKELLQYLAAFEKRVYICAFPYLPMELTNSEIERFLSDPERNARVCPDMLALLFAAIALGAQHSVWDKSGEQWKPDMVDAEAQRGNVYGQFYLPCIFKLLKGISRSFDASSAYLIVHAQTFATGHRVSHHDRSILVQLRSLSGRMDAVRDNHPNGARHRSSPPPKVLGSCPTHASRVLNSTNSLVVDAAHG